MISDLTVFYPSFLRPIETITGLCMCVLHSCSMYKKCNTPLSALRNKAIRARIHPA